MPYRPRRPRARHDQSYGRRWRALSLATRQRQPWCSRCGAVEDLTADHLVPLSRGGDPMGPTETLCRRCNSSKGAG